MFSRFRFLFDSIPKIRRIPHSRSLILGIVAVGLVGGVALAYYAGSAQDGAPQADEESPQWASIAQVDLAHLATVGKNAYFNLEPGYRLRYADDSLTRTVTVRRKTKFVDGVETRVIEEKEERDGQPTKVVWRYYAIDKTAGNLYCFGVHVQNYQDGRLASHRGWRSGDRGAVFTLAMPAAPKTGDTLVRGHDRRVYEVTDTDVKVVTPAGTFLNCLRTEAKGAPENRVKVFAPGVGLVKDGQFTLVKISRTAPRNKAQASAD